MSAKRPDIKLDPPVRILQILSVLGLLVCIAIPIIFYSSLPDRIPRHFGANGLPDVWASRDFIWIFPAGALFAFGLLEAARRYRTSINFTMVDTNDNPDFQFSNIGLLIQWLTVEVMWTVALITFMTVMVAEGRAKGLGEAAIPVALAIYLSTMAFFIDRSVRKGKYVD